MMAEATSGGEDGGGGDRKDGTAERGLFAFGEDEASGGVEACGGLIVIIIVKGGAGADEADVGWECADGRCARKDFDGGVRGAGAFAKGDGGVDGVGGGGCG